MDGLVRVPCLPSNVKNEVRPVIEINEQTFFYSQGLSNKFNFPGVFFPGLITRSQVIPFFPETRCMFTFIKKHIIGRKLTFQISRALSSQFQGIGWLEKDRYGNSTVEHIKAAYIGQNVLVGEIIDVFDSVGLEYIKLKIKGGAFLPFKFNTLQVDPSTAECTYIFYQYVRRWSYAKPMELCVDDRFGLEGGYASTGGVCVFSLIPFLSKFGSWEQFQISACIGGGYWESPGMTWLRNFAYTNDFDTINDKFTTREIPLRLCSIWTRDAVFMQARNIIKRKEEQIANLEE